MPYNALFIIIYGWTESRTDQAFYYNRLGKFKVPPIRIPEDRIDKSLFIKFEKIQEGNSNVDLSQISSVSLKSHQKGYCFFRSCEREFLKHESFLE